MIRNLKKYIYPLILALVLIFTILAYRSMKFNNNVVLNYYTSPLDTATKKSIEKSIDKSEENIAFCFWNAQDNVKLKAESQEYKAENLIFVYGQMRLFYNYQLVSGRTPLSEEYNAMVISESLYQLFFPQGIDNQPVVVIDKKDYDLTGVLKSKENYAILSVNSAYDKGFDYLLLEYDHDKTPSNIENINQALSFPSAAFSLSYYSIKELSTAIMVLVFLIVFLCIIVMAYHMFFSTLNPLVRNIIFFGLLLAFAFLMPKLLTYLPPDWIPNKWSDFSFWSSRLKYLKTVMVNLFSMPGHSGVVEVKEDFIAFLVLATSSFVLSIINLIELLKNNKKDTLAVV